MSLYVRFDTEGLPSFITTNTRERRRLFSSPEACRLLVETLYQVREETRYGLLAFAIMPDHLHVIAVPPPEGLGRTVQFLKGRFARKHNQRIGAQGSVWQSRYHERTLRSEPALLRAIEYVHNNPVVAGFAREPEDYPWSSANGRYATDLEPYLGQAKA